MPTGARGSPRARGSSARVRRLFEDQGFVEVEPAALQASPGNEAHLHGFSTSMIGLDGRARPAYLHTSPEFAMKKLLAAGETRIFALARVFRNRERGALHAPEFTMLEWYRVGAPLEALMDDCAAILSLAAREAGATRFCFRGREADPFAVPERLTVRDGFSAGTPGSTSSILCRPRGAASRTAICWRVRPRRSACASPPTTRGRTSSAESSATGSSRGSASAGRRSSLSIRPRRRRWRVFARTTPAWPSASSSTPAASNSPTPSAS